MSTNEKLIVNKDFSIKGGLRDNGFFLDSVANYKVFKAAGGLETRFRFSLKEFKLTNEGLRDFLFEMNEDQLNNPISKSEYKGIGDIIVKRTKAEEPELTKTVADIIDNGTLVMNDRGQYLYFTIDLYQPRFDENGGRDVASLQFVGYDIKTKQIFVFDETITRKHFVETDFYYDGVLPVSKFA